MKNLKEADERAKNAKEVKKEFEKQLKEKQEI